MTKYDANWKVEQEAKRAYMDAHGVRAVNLCAVKINRSGLLSQMAKEPLT